MDIKKAKQAAAIAWLALGVLAIMNDATLAQMLPVAGFLVLAYLDLYKGKNVGIPTTVLAVLMILLNLSLGSTIDVAMWALVAGAFYPRKTAVAEMPKARKTKKA
jgi:hypothetical protein